MPREVTGVKKNIRVFLVLLAAGIALYAAVIDTFFVSDDFDWLVSGDISIFFRPLTRLSFIANYAIGGLHPLSYHAVNLLLHVLSAYLLFLLIPILLSYFNIELEEHSSRRVSFFCALFFLLLSAHSETVTWISGRTNLLTMVFLQLSLLTYIRSRSSGENKFLALALGSFMLALLSKEAALPFPLIILCLDFFKKLADRQKPVPGFHVVSFFLVLAVYFGIRYMAMGQLLGAYHGDIFNPQLILANFRKFMLRSFLPTGNYLFFIMKYKLDLILAGLLGFFLWKQKKNFLFYCFLISGYVIMLAPVLNLNISLEYTFNERFIYLSSAYGATLLVLLFVLPDRKKKTWIIVLVMLSAVNIFGLFRTHTNWIKAAMISKSLLDSFKEVSPPYGEVDTGKEMHRFPVILNLPDSINGAYIFRRGFTSAIQLFQGWNVKEKIHVVATHTLKNLGDTVIAVNQGEGNYFLDIKKNRFVQSPVPSLAPYYKVKNPNPHQMQLIINKPYRDRPVLYYSNTRLEVVLNESTPGGFAEKINRAFLTPGFPTY